MPYGARDLRPLVPERGGEGLSFARGRLGTTHVLLVHSPPGSLRVEEGILLSWWNSADEQEWRWRIEFYNHR